MKRDMDLIRALLLKLEAEATDRGFSFEEGEAETLKRTLDEVRYNLQQAEQMGLIEVGSKPLNGEWKILRLTPQGHAFLERGQNTEQNHLAPVKLPAAMPALKEPERITLAEGLTLLERHLPTEQAKASLRAAFTRKAFPQSPSFTLEYHEADIDWTTGSVKIHRLMDRFRPTFLRADFNAYFFEDQAAAPVPSRSLSRKVFVVHGHDDGVREAVARFLQQIGFEPIILHEQPNQGRTVIEKVEAHGDVGFAVVLLTPDDEGCVKGGKPMPRARQNVLLELGYFLGRLGREHVCALKRGDVEIPSDFGGVVYETIDASGGWKQALGKELTAAGYEIDWNNQLVPSHVSHAPALIAAAGARASYRFLEFFTAQIRNPNTQRAYMRAVSEFLAVKRNSA